MKYRVNENCIGCGLCAATCPSVFELGEDGYAHAVGEPEDEGTREAAEQAKDSCPVSAIEHR